MRHLDRLRPYLLRQRLQSHHAVHVRHSQRDGHLGLSLRSQVIHNPGEAGEEQSSSLHHEQVHPVPHRLEGRFRRLGEELE